MKAFINDQEVKLYHGATFKNALLQLDEELYKKVLANQAEIRDQDGNHVNLTGSVDNGYQYYIVEN